MVIAHDGPYTELGDGMTKDDLENLWPWFKLKHVPIWFDAQYRAIIDQGLKIQVPDKRVFVLEGKDVIITQDWGPNEKAIGELGHLVEDTRVIGSCRSPAGSWTPYAKARSRGIRSDASDPTERGVVVFRLLEGATPFLKRRQSATSNTGGGEG